MIFKIPGRPQPKQRPRKGRSGKFYTPAATKAYEKKVAQIALEARQQCRQTLLKGPVKLKLIVCKDYVNVDILPHKGAARHGAADLDNIVKAVADGMEGVLYDNDSQIAHLEVNFE
jgi:Holliday junction resolvase RusA-like endonuclease